MTSLKTRLRTRCPGRGSEGFLADSQVGHLNSLRTHSMISGFAWACRKARRKVHWSGWPKFRWRRKTFLRRSAAMLSLPSFLVLPFMASEVVRRLNLRELVAHIFHHRFLHIVVQSRKRLTTQSGHTTITSSQNSVWWKMCGRLNRSSFVNLIFLLKITCCQNIGLQRLNTSSQFNVHCMKKCLWKRFHCSVLISLNENHSMKLQMTSRALQNGSYKGWCVLSCSCCTNTDQRLMSMISWACFVQHFHQWKTVCHHHCGPASKVTLFCA